MPGLTAVFNDAILQTVESSAREYAALKIQAFLQLRWYNTVNFLKDNAVFLFQMGINEIIETTLFKFELESSNFKR